VAEALDRALDTVAVRVDAEPEFVGCVEHRGQVEYAGQGGQEDAHQHTLTFLYAVTALPGRAAGTAPGHRFVAPADLAELPGIPPALASAVGRWWEDKWPVWQGLPVTHAAPWWGGLRQSVRSIRAQLTARRSDLSEIEFRDAAVAMCALVAEADGVIDERERDAMLSSIAGEDVLSHFDATELVQLFDLHVRRLGGDPVEGRRAILRDIGKVRDHPVRARAVVRLGAVIGRADGVFDPVEQAAVLDVAHMLGVDPAILAVQTGVTDPPAAPGTWAASGNAEKDAFGPPPTPASGNAEKNDRAAFVPPGHYIDEREPRNGDTGSGRSGA
jgi:tellurite resistance protein